MLEGLSGAPEQIPMPEVRSLPGSGHISGLKGTIRGCIVPLLQEEEKTPIEPNDSESIKGHITDPQEYYNILNDKLAGRNLSLALVEKLIFGQTPQEFEALCDNENVIDVLKNPRKRNLEYVIELCETAEEFKVLCNNRDVRMALQYAREKNLEYVIELCETAKEFGDLCDNSSVRYVLENPKEKNIEYVIKLCKTAEKFGDLCKNPNVRVVLENPKERNLEYIIKLCETSQEFGDLCNNENVRRDVLENPKEKNIEYVIELCETAKEFGDLCENPNVRDVLRHAKEKNLEYVIKLCKTPQKFEVLCDNKNVRGVLKYTEGKNLEYAIELYKIKKLQGFKVLCKNKNVRYVLRNAIEKNLEYVIKLCETSQEFKVLCKNKNVRNVLEDAKRKNLEYVVNLCETSQNFGDLCDNENVRDILKYAKEKNLDYAIELYKIETLQGFKVLCNNENVRYILLYAIEKNLEYVVKLYKTPQEFKALCNNENVRNVLRYAEEKNLEYVIELCKTAEEFENIIYSLHAYLFIDLNEKQLENLLNCLRNGFNKRNIGEDYGLLFPVKSLGSKVLDEIIGEMSVNEGKDIHELLREVTKDYLDKQDFEQQETGILELAIYLRYDHTVDYPEIGELIIIFFQEVIKKGWIKGVKGIKILPRKEFVSPRNTILDQNSRFCNVSGDDFTKELNTNSIPFYLSHSSNQSVDQLAITSEGTLKGEGQISLGLELEKRYDNSNTDKRSIKEIFEILLNIVKEINIS